MLPLRVAVRFLRRSKVQSALIILGIAVGIAVQVFVGSLITSLQASLLESTVGSSPHLTLEPTERGGTFVYDTALRDLVSGTAGVTAVSEQLVVPVLAVVEDTGTPLTVKAGDFQGLDAIYKLSSRIQEGSGDMLSEGLLLGTDLLDQYGLAVGDPLSLTLADGSIVETSVRGAFDLGSSAANTALAFAEPGLFVGTSAEPAGRVSVVEVQIDDVFRSSEIAASWRAAAPGVVVGDWQERNAELLSALASQGASSTMIQVFVIIAVMLGIASTLAISAAQKTRQVGILKALGLRDSRAGLVFLYQAGILGVAGTVLGLAAALGLIRLFTSLSSGSDSGLFPIEPRLGFVLFSAGIGIAIALLSAVIPYRKTSRLDPIEVIQGG